MLFANDIVLIDEDQRETGREVGEVEA